MIRTVALVASATVAAATLAGCGGDSAYCAAVKDNESALQSFGVKRTDAAFAGYAKVARTIGADAPSSVTADWTSIAKATSGVLAAHRDVGISLQDMSDPDKVAALSETDRATIQKAYDRFNRSRTPRKAVVRSIETECKITLQ